MDCMLDTLDLQLHMLACSYVCLDITLQGLLNIWTLNFFGRLVSWVYVRFDGLLDSKLFWTVGLMGDLSFDGLNSVLS